MLQPTCLMSGTLLSLFSIHATIHNNGVCVIDFILAGQLFVVLYSHIVSMQVCVLCGHILSWIWLYLKQQFLRSENLLLVINLELHHQILTRALNCEWYLNWHVQLQLCDITSLFYVAFWTHGKKSVSYRLQPSTMDLHLAWVQTKWLAWQWFHWSQ